MSSNSRFRLALATWLACVPLAVTAAPSVQLWETNLVIPTYLAAPPSPVPRFYEGRTYQGAKATFYPYPVQDVLTDTKTNKTYKAVFLENQYLQISVIPELGGRIWSAVDKTSDYDFFYRQHVVKPALIGMLGAWISGGVEWNVPHHHRATSFSPVDYTLQTNADGSATIWVGEIEWRHRLKWLVGMTLYPDRSYLELTCKVFNRTPFAWPILFWINAAVHANTNYQVLFPSGTEWAAQHGKPEFASWPMARQVYGGTDYTRGVDISWWKNHPNPVSFFAWNYEDDWLGGYDHGRQAGVIHVADHHIAPGKKFFEWGNGPEGEMWTKILSDEDGPYLELMAGAWSDNQPDYSWIAPGETREWKHWWYPINQMRGVKFADRNVALNLEITNGIARVAVNATKPYTNVEVALMWMEADMWRCTTNIGPSEPFYAEVPLNESVLENPIVGLSVTERLPRYPELLNPGRELLLVAYWPQPPKNSPMPKPVEKPKAPKDYATADELYFTGQRIEQLYSPAFEARPYYEEMLRRDPGDYRANTALGVLLCKQWRWAEAARYLSNAIARASAHHIRPKDGEAFYYLGLALRQLAAPYARDPRDWRTRDALLDAATDALMKATWSAAWRGPASYQLALIAISRHKYIDALTHADAALAAGSHAPQARSLKAAILRAVLRPEEAEAEALRALALDPLDGHAAFELYLLYESRFPAKAQPAFDRFCRLTRRDPQAWLELAIEYGEAGFGSLAAWLLDAWPADKARTNGLPPLLRYVRAYYGGTEPTESQPPTRAAAWDSLVFPLRFEEEHILRWATAADTNDAIAPYLLGCLLYDNQPDNAIQAWEESRRRDERFALTHRNLALAYAQHRKDFRKAIASLEKAIELAPTEPRFFFELDRLYEAAGVPVARRLEMLSCHHHTVAGRDDAVTREIELLIVAGLEDPAKLDRALALLATRHFRNWEGSTHIHNVYVDACLTRGQLRLAAGQAPEALRDFLAALDYPDNLEVGRARRSPRIAQIQYLIGIAYEALGDTDSAQAAFQKAVAGRDGSGTESSYFRGRALQKLGRADEAQPIFQHLIKAGEEQLTRGETPDYFAKFGERQSESVRLANAHYLIGLGQLGLGHTPEAQAAFRQALAVHPAHRGAAVAAAPLPGL